MKIRDASVVNQDLGFLALPEGFVSVPVTNYIGTEIEDSMNGCQYANDESAERRNNNANYIDYWWISNFSKDPLADALGIDKETMQAKNFPQVYSDSDAFVAMEFENMDFPVWSFDTHSYLQMRTIQKIDLVGMFSKETRRLVYSRILSKPMA